jgi:hypothetical protein
MVSPQSGFSIPEFGWREKGCLTIEHTSRLHGLIMLAKGTVTIDKAAYKA